MSTNSNVLAIGTEETSDMLNRPSISSNRRANFESDFEQYLQKILLNGGKPLKSLPDDKAVERFASNEIKKNGSYYYEFGPKFKIKGWLTNGPTFEPKGVLRRVKDRISKEHWIKDNVAKYTKDSRDFIQATVGNALHEEQIEIYQYLCYLNDNFSNK